MDKEKADIVVKNRLLSIPVILLEKLISESSEGADVEIPDGDLIYHGLQALIHQVKNDREYFTCEYPMNDVDMKVVVK